jgi:tetratricopeptide (TPR) repeat protein
MMGGSRRIAALLASVLLANPALAQPKGPSDKDKQIAGDLVKKAIARSQAGDHSAAIEIYLQAYTIAPNSLLLSNIGAEFQQSGKPQEALRYFCLYLDKDPTGTNATYATSQARSLQNQLGNKDVDDNDVCAPPKPRPEKPKPPKDPPTKPPPTEPPRPDPDETTSSGGSTLKYVGLAAGITGLAALGIGVYDGVQAQNITDQINKQPLNMPWPDNIRDLQRRGQAYENLQIDFLIAGGVLAATGAILLVVSRSDASSKRASDKATVMVAPTTNGFVVRGHF